MTTLGNEYDEGDVRAALEFWPSPPPWGWTADDLDRLPVDGPNGELDFFSRIELLDGALVFGAPQAKYHATVTAGIADGIDALSPQCRATAIRMDVKLGHRTRLCPDVLMTDPAVVHDGERTYYDAHEVRLVVEVVSPESEERDRRYKPRLYAEAGIAHFWRVEESDGKPVVYVYELDPATRAYAVTGIHHGKLSVSVPFSITIDLDALPR